MPVSLEKCPSHPDSSDKSQYGGFWCKSQDCKWAHKEFVNEDQQTGDLTKVLKWRLPAGGKWLTKEDYLLAAGDVPAAPSASPEAPGDRQTSIVRQTCIKAASVSLQHGMGTPEEKAGGILYLAAALEDWVNR